MHRLVCAPGSQPPCPPSSPIGPQNHPSLSPLALTPSPPQNVGEVLWRQPRLSWPGVAHDKPLIPGLAHGEPGSQAPSAPLPWNCFALGHPNPPQPPPPPLRRLQRIGVNFWGGYVGYHGQAGSMKGPQPWGRCTKHRVPNPLAFPYLVSNKPAHPKFPTVPPSSPAHPYSPRSATCTKFLWRLPR